MSLASLRIMTLIASGPLALWILRPLSRFSTPCKEMVMSGIIEWGLGPLLGRSPAGHW